MFDIPDDDDDLLAAAAAEEPPAMSFPPDDGSGGMSQAQADRAEKNRLKAVALKKARLMTALDSGIQAPKHITGEDPKPETSKKTETIDTGAGFFIDEEDEDSQGVPAAPLLAPIIDPDRPSCLECSQEFADSYLLQSFDYEVCDKCRDTERDGKHELITKTDAVKEFLLKDHDLESREPVLKFITRKNPHNNRWGNMKLYLRLQVEQRALDVWESPENLEKAHSEREEKRHKAKTKKFMGKLKALRMQVRGSLYQKKDFAAEHQHDYGPEEALGEDEFSRTCNTCGFVNRYEKM